jgi:hypothetical protein
MASYQLPGLPGLYHDLTYSVKLPPSTANTPPTSVSSGDASSDLSTLSGSFRPGPKVPGGSAMQPPPNNGCNTFVRNLEPDAALQAIIPAHLLLWTVIKNDPVPVNDANLPMCLSFHLRRGCWSQCKRAHDHNRTLSARERQWVVSFMSTQLAKLSTVLPPAATAGTPAATIPKTIGGPQAGTVTGAAPGLTAGTGATRG